MAILSWLKSKKRLMRRSAIDEFKEYTREEADRLHNSDGEFDDTLYWQAVDLVLRKLESRNRNA